MDQAGLMDTAEVTVLVTKIPSGATSPLTLVAVLILAGVTVGSFAVAMGMRRKPFVIRDIMLVHNDGFLIGRHAAAQAGEIDEDILSGMLTAVLGFVEDSMASSKDTLRTFGFKEYQVMVKRGKKAYMAVVYEGDAPDNMDEALGEFMTKVEKIYRKSLDHWTGDIEVRVRGRRAPAAGVREGAHQEGPQEREGPEAVAGEEAGSGGEVGPERFVV